MENSSKSKSPREQINIQITLQERPTFWNNYSGNSRCKESPNTEKLETLEEQHWANKVCLAQNTGIFNVIRKTKFLESFFLVFCISTPPRVTFFIADIYKHWSVLAVFLNLMCSRGPRGLSLIFFSKKGPYSTFAKLSGFFPGKAEGVYSMQTNIKD